ncbi:hypothetical protein [Thermoactinomyces sp. DSM 45892]|uniref:BclA C-terminal domain-containing protein n=1 Tax=Thermoactinomyces sp. DSM 45892 TaxID=1882753 RepID=UPI000899E0F8|nr:hypothetical protein [Thermoactinomyces sp. DSM 45892]SDY38858.1 hypothetical protein SAMN05444416_104120 [Thermoactinomyces sp. DSM 45892]
MKDKISVAQSNCPSSNCPIIRRIFRRLGTLGRRIAGLNRRIVALENGGGLSAYGQIYNLSNGIALTIPAGGNVPFSNNGVLNNITHTAGSTNITLPQAGQYEINFQVSVIGALLGLLAAFAVTVNGTVVPQSTFAINLTGILGLAAQVSGSVIIDVPANATITLRNVSGVPVPLLETLIGATTPLSNASMTIKRLGPA